MKRSLKQLNRALGLSAAPPPFHVDTKLICRQVHDSLVTEQRERKLYMKQKIKMAAVLVAAVVALTGTALAVGPTMWTMLTKALGSFAPYAQVIEGASVTDQGLRFTVEAVLSDAEEVDDTAPIRVDVNRTVIYVSVTDLKGDRLDENTALNNYFRKCVSYDAKSRTALFAIDYSGDILENGTMTIDFSRVMPGHVRLNNLSFPRELFKNITLSTQTLTGSEIERSSHRVTEKAVVLKPGQTPMPIDETDFFSLSSAGFDQDGVFHILYEMADGVSFEYPPLYSPAFDDGRERPRSYTTDTVWFGNGKYLDVAYVALNDGLNDWPAFITRESVSHLTYTDGYIDLYTKPQIEGNWTLTFPVEVLPNRTIRLDGSGIKKNLTLTEIKFSPIHLQFHGTTIGDHGGPIGNFPITFYLKDGTLFTSDAHMDYGPGAWMNNLDGTGVFTDRWTFDRAINPEDVTAIAIGMWYIPLEGDTALPGHWLSELPQ